MSNEHGQKTISEGMRLWEEHPLCTVIWLIVQYTQDIILHRYYNPPLLRRHWPFWGSVSQGKLIKLWMESSTRRENPWSSPKLTSNKLNNPKQLCTCRNTVTLIWKWFADYCITNVYHTLTLKTLWLCFESILTH